MLFDEKYYKDIWGSVHRHDYCPTLASELVGRFGRKTYLDIGTGCGYLIVCLQKLGATAWGVEISDYALANSCAPQYVLKASVVKLPFKDNSFDVVHSQGLWEYLTEKDIPQAWSECKRMGKNQVHNIDTTEDKAEWSKEFVTHKPIEWWNEVMSQ